MAETDLRQLPNEKSARYAALRGEIAAVLAGETNLHARCASIASMSGKESRSAPFLRLVIPLGF